MYSVVSAGAATLGGGAAAGGALGAVLDADLDGVAFEAAEDGGDGVAEVFGALAGGAGAGDEGALGAALFGELDLVEPAAGAE